MMKQSVAIVVVIDSYLLLKDANFSTALELAVRFGKTLIIQEVDGVEPVLYPLLRGDLVSQGKCLYSKPVLSCHSKRGPNWFSRPMFA